MYDFLTTEAALTGFLHRFETGCLPRERWTHAAHIAGGTVFLRRHGIHVLAPMRAAIQQHNASVGTPPSAYHETLTVFWLAVLQESMRETAFLSDFDAVKFTVYRFGEERKLHETYYSFDVVRSEEARARWSAPDVHPLAVSFHLAKG